MGSYTKHHCDLDGDLQTLNFLHADLGLECTGISIGKVQPGTGYPFFHAHEQQEETYFCLEGSFTLVVDGEELTLTKGDIVRLAPEAMRAVGNKTDTVGTMLIVGAMPFDQKYHGDEGRSLISDGVRGEGEPEWK